jgi:hypothetical protein
MKPESMLDKALYCNKATERHRAGAEGRGPPALTQEEIAAMRKSNVETVAGGGVVTELRNAPGWQSLERVLQTTNLGR